MDKHTDRQAAAAADRHNRFDLHTDADGNAVVDTICTNADITDSDGKRYGKYSAYVDSNAALVIDLYTNANVIVNRRAITHSYHRFDFHCYGNSEQHAVIYLNIDANTDYQLRAYGYRDGRIHKHANRNGYAVGDGTASNLN